LEFQRQKKLTFFCSWERQNTLLSLAITNSIVKKTFCETIAFLKLKYWKIPLLKKEVDKIEAKY
jgi:hypothetical protein